MKRSPIKRVCALLLLVMFSSGVLTACNTMAGAGKDIQKGGEKINEEAKEHKKY